jgi:hypothetical protein
MAAPTAPAAGDEAGKAALIVPAFEQGVLVDLVAEDFQSRRDFTRLGAAYALGADEVELARSTGKRLLLFDSVFNWLRADCRGAVVLDWKQALHELNGIRTVYCNQALARQVYSSTRRSFSPPEIYVPVTKGGQRDA